MRVKSLQVFAPVLFLSLLGPSSTAHADTVVITSFTFSSQFPGDRHAFGQTEVNEVPEPASMGLLISGLGFMAGVLKKRAQKGV